MMVQPKEVCNMRYEVILSAHGNIDHGQDPFTPLYGVYQGKGEADSIEGLQKIVRDYIDENGLGSMNWTGGEVFVDNRQIGYISYNGRFWTE